MTELLQTSVFISLFTLGLYYLSIDGFILSFYRAFIYKIFGVFYHKHKDEYTYYKQWAKPVVKVLINCPPCMCSFYGIIISVILFYQSGEQLSIFAINEFIFYGISIFFASTINRLITQLI